jgi:ABC-2 type transport system permease protein
MAVGPRLRPYLYYVRCAFQRRAAYRLANFTGIAVNFFFFLIHAQIFLAFFGERELVSGWRPQDAVLYFAISEALLLVLGGIPNRSAYDLGERVRTGDVTLDLARPVRLWARSLAEGYGVAAYYLFARSIVLYVGSVLLYRLEQPLVPELLLLPFVLLLAIAISVLLTYIAQASAFWFEFSHGPVGAMNILLWFFGGIAVPLDFYPDALRWVCDALPFRGAIFTPVALATGRLSGAALSWAVLHQVVWLSLLFAIAMRIEARGVRRLVLHGG